jgi:antitoxin component of MazEF toxin-antitoxin module
MSVRVDPESGEMVEDRTLRTAGGSTVLTIPPDVLRQANLQADEDVEVAVSFEEDGVIKIRQKEDG